MRRRLAIVTVVVLAVIVQLAVVARLRLVGIAPDLVAIAVAAVAMRAGSTAGALAGFAGGLAIDLFLPTPVGLFALADTLVGYEIGRLAAGVLEPTWWTGPVVAALAAFAATAGYVVVGGLVGESQLVRVHTLVVLPVTTMLTGLLAVVVFPLFARAIPVRRTPRADQDPVLRGAW